MIPFRGVSQASQQLGQRAIPQRQASAGAPPVTQPFRTQNQAYPPQLQHLPPSAAQQAEQSLDPSDFPALGSATWSNAGTAGGGGTSLQQQAQQQQNLLSSYASQAGTAVQPPPLASSNQPPPGSHPSSQALPSPALPSAGQPPSAGLPSASAAAAAAAQAAHNRDFTPDDFPALGGFGGQAELGLGGHPNGQGGPPQNGLSLMGGRPGSGHAAPGQEQASAVAALQHQHLQSQHRANLLGSMNGAGGPGSPAQQAAQQPRTVSGQQPFPSETDKRQQGFNLKHGPPSQAPWPASTPTGLGSFPLPSPHFPGSTNGTNGTNGALPQGSTLSPPPPQPQLAVGGGNAGSSPGSATLPSQAGSLPQPPSTPGARPVAPIQQPAQQVLFSPADRYGLLGLLHIIKSTDPDLSMLALGSDLTTLGLDLGATDNLYSTFITPWSDSKAAAALNIEPEFHLPSCYNVQPPPAGTKIGNFSDETLFFLFYNHPRDALQEMAAHELYKHNWRYHKELRLWLTKEAGTEATQKTQSYERGSYIFFDPTLWERVRKDFVLVFESLEARRA